MDDAEHALTALKPISIERGTGAALIEVSLEAISVLIGRGADVALIAAALDELKSGR